MRILHTADWQLGLRAAQAGERAAEVRAERLATVARIVDLAHELAVDLVLVAGDVFDRQEIDEAVLHATIGQLDRLTPIPVVLLPGNHDPLEVGGVWDRRAFARAGAHVLIAREPRELEILPGVAVYPCPLTQRISTQDPTAWIPPRCPEDRRLRIGLAHGALDSLPKRGNFPIALDRAEACDLDYLALGDWHGSMVRGRTAYPGAPEQASFGEKSPGYVLLVELEAGDAEAGGGIHRRPLPRVEQHRVGRFVWCAMETEIRDRTDLVRLEAELAELARPEDLLLRIQVTTPGADAPLRAALDGLEERLRSRLFVLDWTLEERGDLDGALPDGLLGEVDHALAAILDGAPPPDGLEDLGEVAPDVLREARARLRTLVAISEAQG
ncbi:MAG TPA: DNA repair exonuclease [Thermoanaerobaculia bacterium]|nr:DNA repair exonuclease [Thermoanaerobaculia bacterium]